MPPAPRGGPSGLLRVCSLFLLVCGAGSFAASVSELEDRIGEEKKELTRMREELEEGRRRVRELSEKARDQEAQLQQVEANMQLGNKLLQAIDSTEVHYRDLVSRSQKEVALATEGWRARRALLAHRMRQMYEKGRPRPEVSWIGRSDPGEWARTLADFRSVVRADQDLLDLVRAREKAARHELHAHQLRVDGLVEVSEQKKKDLADLETERKSKAGNLAELRGREAEERKRLADLEASQKALAQLLGELEKRREKAEEEARRREEERKKLEEQHRKEVAAHKKQGKPPPPPIKIEPPPKEDKALAGPPPAKKGLCWPVQGSILSRFGLETNPVLGTVTRNLGVEIGGKQGQPVLSAAGGRVAAVTQLPGRGTTVILEHPGGYFSIYGQLARTKVSEGQAVSACSEVGTLAPLAPPRVYFEYRHNLKAEDPLEWLTK
jgi:septal ring factor EnvC (AmiA/AmiB activator)